MRGDFWMTRFRGDSTTLIQRLLSSARQNLGIGQAILCFSISILFLHSALFWFLYVMAAYPMNVSNYVVLLK